MTQLVKYSVEGQIAHIILNEPDRLNSLSTAMVNDLMKALTRANKDEDAKVIILSGEGKSFCAGGDLKTMQAFSSSSEIIDWMQNTSKLTKMMIEMDKYVVSAVHGYAAGAGFSLALASDFVVADKEAKFALSFKNVGLIPDLGLIKLLSERVPLPIAKEWISSGKVISAEQAYERGLLNRLSDKQVLKDAIEFSKFLLSGPPLSNKYVKYLLNHANQFTYETALTQENFIQTILLQSEDHREGVAAYFEKREPIFKGR